MTRTTPGIFAAARQIAEATSAGTIDSDTVSPTQLNAAASLPGAWPRVAEP
nr:hypothetical protein [Streptomyces sp. RPA4-2]QIY66495.1 hypothetical protein HEP85_39635 [Streptomyces sp. RPA4-2]